MKRLVLVILGLLPFWIFAQQSDYLISSYLTQGPKAPNTHYIGEAWLNGVLQGDGEFGYNITKATFKAKSTRMSWGERL